MQREVRKERSGWRDERISMKHRQWGWDCPGVDIDFMMVEFNQGVPKALVEYKAFGATFPNVQHPTYKALRTLADAAGIPLFIVFYDSYYWYFRVTPVNKTALAALPRTTVMTEREYVALMYRIRGLPMPSDLTPKLGNYKQVR